MMYLPNYRNGSIVNLMSSIANAYGAWTKYRPLRILPPGELKGSKNILLLVIDGLGYEYLKKNGRGTVFERYMKGHITSVFPTTTAAAIPSFLTGVAPQQHACTGWFMHLKEIGCVATILPFVPRYGSEQISKQGVRKEDIITEKPFAARIKTKSYIVTDRRIAEPRNNKGLSAGAVVVAYRNLNEFFPKIRKTIEAGKNRKFIYAYWPGFDHIAHTYGVGSGKTKKHFFGLERRLRRFLGSIKETGTTVIVTADHGFIDTTRKRSIWLEDHPKLNGCLTLPLCGDPRVVYCYVHPSKAKDFETYVKKKLKKQCYLFRSEELIRKGYFGLFTEAPSLSERVGDYTLIMKENYALRDTLPNKKRKFLKGIHSGISKEEMLVPLIVVKTG